MVAAVTNHIGLYTFCQSLGAQLPGYAGYQYLAFGSGDPSWSTSPPAAPAALGSLYAEFARIPVSTVSFLLADGVTISVAPTPLAVVTARLTGNALGEAYGSPATWREVGLFGGNGTAVANSGLLCVTARDAPRIRHFGDPDMLVSLTVSLVVLS